MVVNVNVCACAVTLGECIATFIHKYSDFLVAMTSVVIARDLQ